MEDTATQARFSEATYRMLEKGNADERINRINNDIKDTGYVVDRKNSNRNILTLRNETEGKSVIAVRGTDTSGKKTGVDIMSDITYALGQSNHSNEFRKRRNNIKNSIKDSGDDKVILTGHSLGGGVIKHSIANSNQIRRRIIDNGEVHTFNSASHPFLRDQTKVSKASQKALKDKVIHHRTRNDVVSKGLETMIPFGKVKTYDTKTSNFTKKMPKGLADTFDSLEALHAHKLIHFK
tara:strand:+ start:3347 stop:4057 length:711 start_codon:yes stop_codon:yes gene_type:complete